MAVGLILKGICKNSWIIRNRGLSMTRFAYSFCLWLIGGLLSAQPPYVRQGSIGTVKEPPREESSPQRPGAWPVLFGTPVTHWLGRRVIFAPYVGPEKGMKSQGYPSFRRDGSPLDQKVSFQELSGKIGRVVAVSPAANPEVTVALEGSDARYVCSTVVGSLSLPGVAFLDEIDQARKELIGKAAWTLSRVPLRTYSAESHKVESIPIGKFSPVTIEDVVAGTDDSQGPSVLLILRDERGEEGYLAVYLSTRHAASLDELLTPSDPMKDHAWPRSVWEGIQYGNVTLGMSMEQVRLAMGEPTARKVAQATEDWEFDGGTRPHFENLITASVHFDRGIVTKLDQSKIAGSSGVTSGTTPNGGVTLGMSMEQVRRALGEPHWRVEEQTATGVQGYWYINTSGVDRDVHFNRGAVTEINEHRQQPLLPSGGNVGDEITRVLRSGHYQSLPPLQRAPSLNSSGAPGLTVSNQTVYDLRIVLFGPFDTRTLSVNPGGSQSVTLSAGTYQALATASAQDVLPAVGEYSFSNGSNYSITYTISSR